jgi:hypothetical protein
VISYTAAERWAGAELTEKALGINPAYAADEIMKRVKDICPAADQRKIKKFAGL